MATAAKVYDVGDKVRIWGRFYSDKEQTILVDPDAVFFTIKMINSGSVLNYTYGEDAEVVRSAVGVYYLDHSVTQRGDHWYRWYSTGDGQGAEENMFEVKEQRTG